MLAVYYAGKLPVVQAGHLADEVAEAGHGHAVGRGLEYIRVADDDLGAVGGHGGLEVVDVHDADAGGEAVHRRAGGDGEARQAQLEAGIARHVRDGAGAHAYHKVAVRRDADDDLAEGGLVKAEVRQHVHRRFYPRRAQKLLTARARDLIGDLVAQQVRLLIAETARIVRQALKRARAYLHALYGHVMRPSAVAVELDVEIFSYRLGLSIHFHKHVSLLDSSAGARHGGRPQKSSPCQRLFIT